MAYQAIEYNAFTKTYKVDTIFHYFLVLLRYGLSSHSVGRQCPWLQSDYGLVGGNRDINRVLPYRPLCLMMKQDIVGALRKDINFKESFPIRVTSTLI